MMHLLTITPIFADDSMVAPSGAIVIAVLYLVALFRK
jgi:hypothetical protein